MNLAHDAGEQKMVTINHEKCNQCGLCVEICHESCMHLVRGRLEIDDEFCSTCTQCIAVCPNLALSWEKNAAVPFDVNRLPTGEQLDELLRRRRTIRFFKREKPSRQVLADIIHYGIYAPTHSFNFRVLVIDEDDLIEKVDRAVYRYNEKIYKYLYKNKIIHRIVSRLAVSYEKEYLKAKPKLEKSLKMGRAYLLRPPALVMVVGDKRTPLAKESAQYCIYNMYLFAMTKGLGCRILVGNQMFMNKSKELRKSLGLSPKEKIFAVLGMGYPSRKFRNKVAGRTLDIQWNSGAGE